MLYNANSGKVRLVKRSSTFDDQYPDGIPVRMLADRSVRKSVERIDELTRTRERLLTEFLRQGLSDGNARLRVTDALQELGFLHKPPTITATVVNGPAPNGTVFTISRREFLVGLFQDIDQAIRSPGTPVEHSTGTYLRHTDFETSEKLKRFLKDGGEQFYVDTGNVLYELRITPSKPATR